DTDLVCRFLGIVIDSHNELLYIWVLALESVKDAQAAEIIALKAIIKKLEKKCKPSISHHRAWLKSVQRLSMKKRFGKKESEPVNEGRIREETEELVSIARPRDSTVRPDVSNADPIVSPTTTTRIFDDEDITMVQTLIKIKEEKAKEKGVSIKDIQDSSRPARSILTLKPLSAIDPKYKGKCVLEEQEPAKKMTRSDLDAAQIAKYVEVARLVYEEELAELEREKEKRQREEASKAAIAEMYDEVQVGIEADELFAAKLQQEEREEYTIEERAKFLVETIAAQRKFRAAQRSAEIRSLYERQKMVIDDFKPMVSDDAVDKENVLEETDNTKIEVKQEGYEESIRKRPGRRLKMKSTKKSKRKKTDSDLKEVEHLKAFLQIVPDEEGEVDYEVLDKIFPIINWKSKFYHLDRHGAKCIYYRIFRPDGCSRWIKTFLKWTMFEETADGNLWKNQEEWILKSWNFYENCGVYTLTLEDGTEIYMLAERSKLMNLEAMMEVRRICKCWFYNHTTNGHQFTMSNKHQELTIPEANGFCKELAGLKQTTLDDKDWKLIKEKFEELQCVWIQPSGVQEAQDELMTIMFRGGILGFR
nr:hypothetical protein [Tanacetum cinerariifolium]